jgi:hypothetical protein
MSALAEMAHRLMPSITQRYDSSDERKFDLDTVKLLHDKEAPRGERRAKVRSWLYGYSVLRGIRSETVEKIVNAVLEYADGPRPVSLGSNQADIAREFFALQALLAPPLGNRNSDSLTSKALWLCYPDDVPILDGYAERTLQVICRMHGIAIVVDPNNYRRFLDAWFSVYEECKEALDTTSMQYPFRVRLLDWLLWYLGQPNFD